jgi:hypothetical protein
VVETLAPADIAHLGVGHHDALQPTWDLGRHVRGANVGHAHQVAQRQHARDPAMVDDGHVAVPALTHAQQCRATVVPVVDGVNRHGHRLADGHRRRPPVGVEPQHVALGDDADGVLLTVDDDHRSDTQTMHPVDELDQCLVGACGDRR